ncbi:MAG: carbon-nitrogen hydrolase family protein [Acidithiobacillus sp.]
MRNRLAPSVLLAAVCGFVWQYAYAGPILALALIPLVLFQRTRRSRFAVALAYYLAGSHGIPLAAAVFFGPGDHWLEGAALWLVSSALLASGWAFADKAWKAAAVMLLDALMPPMAFFDWISPLTASGVLFPDWGLFGVAALLVGISITPWIYRKRALVLLPILPIAWNLAYLSIPMHPDIDALRHPQKGCRLQGLAIQSINLHMGPSTHSILTNFTRLQDWVAKADQHRQARVLLLPETLLTWWPGNAHYIERHVPQGQTWLVGASIPLKQPGLFADGIEAVTDKGSRMVFASVLPVPVSMWRPWHMPTGDSFGRMDYKAFWWQKPVRTDGKSMMAEICYDQLLPFSWLEVTLYRPDTVLLTSNVWWAKGTGAPQIQRASAWAWSRLAGSTDMEAENS